MKFDNKGGRENLIQSILVFMFFFALELHYFFNNNSSFYFRYFIEILFFSYSLLKINHYPSLYVLFCLFVCIITGMFNIIYIGNNTWFKLLYTVMSFFIASMFIKDTTSLKSYKYAIYIHALTIAYLFFQNGITYRVYENSSNNYISVVLLFPCVIYYSLLAERGEQCVLLPAATVFVLSVLAGGRGGILSSGILFIAVLMERGKNRWGWLFIGAVIGITLVIFVMGAGEGRWLFQRFYEFGVSDHNRFIIWIEYLSAIGKDYMYCLYGVPFEESPLVVGHKGNLHNSFLNIFAYNGLIMTILVIVCIFQALYFAIKEKKWMYLSCFLVLCIRGATDSFFWGTRGTPIFLFFLLLPHFYKNVRCNCEYR